MPNELHVIFGGGQVGQPLARILRERGLHCMNPPYSAQVWADVIPKYVENLIAAAGKAGARLVVLKSVYMLGRTAGRPMNEDTPMNPCSRKGEIRAREAECLFEAHRRGEIRATAGRASDFSAPAPQSATWGINSGSR